MPTGNCTKLTPATVTPEGPCSGWRRLTQRVILAPKAKRTVPANRSHGTIFMKVICGVCSKSSAPATLPSSVTMISGATLLSSGRLSDLRYADVEASIPGQTATVLVALAFTGSMPVKSSEGKVIKLPPPAIALATPATNAAEKRSAASEELTVQSKALSTQQSALSPQGF